MPARRLESSAGFARKLRAGRQMREHRYRERTKQRFEIARALMSDAKILLMDVLLDASDF